MYKMIKRVASLINLWVIAGAVLIAFFLLSGTYFAVLIAKDSLTPANTATVIVNVIYSPTSTPAVITPLLGLTSTPTTPIPPSPPPGIIAVGAFVQVAGTGGDGLRLRSVPGLNGEIRFLGYESEVFQVQDGPRSSDGYTWWLLVAPYDQTISGWAVANFMAVVQNP
jgi:hypothetical protein